MTDAGVAYVQLVPSMRGFSSSVTKGLGRELTAPLAKAGEEAGEKTAEGVASGMNRRGGRLSGAVSKIGNVIKTGLAAVGIAAGLLLVAGLGQAFENQDATAKLVAQLGGSEWAQDMGKVAGNLYKQGFGESTADTGEALRQVISAQLIPEDSTNAEWEALTAQFLTFSDVMDKDMQGSIRAVSNILRTGLAPDAETALDILTRGIQQTGDPADDLLDTFTEYSVQFQALGLDASDAMGLLMQGAQGGARDLDTTADALKELSIRGKDFSSTSREAFGQLGLDADAMFAAFAAGGPQARAATDEVITALANLEDQNQRNVISTALFGTKSEDLQAALTNLDLSSAAAGLGNVEGATDQLGSAYDTAATRITIFKRKALDKLVTFLGGTVIPAVEGLAAVIGPVLSGAIDSLGPVLGQVSAFWNSLTTGFTEDEGTPVERFALTIRDAFQSAQPAVEAFSSAFSTFATFVSQNKELVGGALTAIAIVITAILLPALWSLAAPIIAAAAPFLLLVAAAAALGAGLVWLYNNVDGFRTFVDEALPQVAAIFSDAFELIKTIVSGAVTVVTALWSWFGDDIIAVALIAWELIKGIVSGGLDVIQGIIRTVTAILKGDWAGAWDGIKQILSGALTIIVSILKAALGLLLVLVKLAWRGIKNLFMLGFNAVKNRLRSDLDTMVGFFRALPGRIRSAFSTLASAITSPFRSAFNGIRSLWNRTAGGFSFSIPSWVPGVGGKGWSMPRMHTGGIFNSGRGEGPALLQDGEGVFTREQMAAIGAGVTAPAGAAKIVLAADGETQFLRWIRSMVRTEGGGDVDIAFGGI